MGEVKTGQKGCGGWGIAPTRGRLPAEKAGYASWNAGGSREGEALRRFPQPPTREAKELTGKAPPDPPSQTSQDVGRGLLSPFPVLFTARAGGFLDPAGAMISEPPYPNLTRWGRGDSSCSPFEFRAQSASVRTRSPAHSRLLPSTPQDSFELPSPAPVHTGPLIPWSTQMP